MANQNKNPHESEMILKMDVEGAEYKALLATPNDILSRFSQIYIELHSIDEIDTIDKYTEKYNLMKKLTDSFYVYHAHANNFAGISQIGPYKIPQVIELTLINRNTPAVARAHKKNLPLRGVDTPNYRKKKDISLSF